MWRVAQLVLLFGLLFASHTLADGNNTAQYSTTPVDSQNGSFIYPRAYPLTFQEGSTVNLTWSTTWIAVNLFYYQRGQLFTNKIAVQHDKGWYNWDISIMSVDLTEPFVIHAINYYNSGDESMVDDFWSPMFYVSRSRSTQSSPSSTRPANQLSGLPSIGSDGMTPTTSSTPWWEEGYSYPTADSKGIGAANLAGIVIGVATMFIILMVFLGIMFLRRRKEKAEDKANMAAHAANTVVYVPETQEYTPVPPHEMYVRPMEMEGTRTCAEMPAERRVPDGDRPVS